MKECEKCGGEFSVVKSRIKKARFCSYKCYWEWKKGQPISPKTLQKMLKSRKGYVHSSETRKKISVQLIGNKNGIGNKSNLGRELPKDQVEKIRNSHRGEQNYLWKGEKVSYSGIHHWITRERGRPKKCEHCGTEEAKRYEWANVSGKYERNLTDWIRLCKKCHNKYDRIKK